MSGGARAGAPVVLGALLLASVACSTAKPADEDQTCVDQSDCKTGQICSEGFCYPDSLPPREAIALDIRTDGFSATPFRLELLGTDLALERILDRPPLRYHIARPAVRDRLRLSLSEYRSVLAPGEAATGIPAANINLQQTSRFGRAPWRVPGLSIPLPDPAAPDVAPVIVLPWPHYDPADVAGDLPLIADVAFLDDVPGEPDLPLWTRGVVSREIVRKKLATASDHEIAITSVRECHRKVSGQIRFPHGPPPAPMDGTDLSSLSIAVSMRHAGRPDDGDPDTPVCDPTPADGTPAICSPATLLGQSYSECETQNQCPEPHGCYPDPVDDVKRCGCRLDSECPKGQVCNIERQQCALDLTDRPAIRDVNAEFKDGATITTAVYTYCDEDLEADRTMEFIVTVNPDARLGLPRLSFRVVADFLYSDVATYLTPTPKYTSLRPICLPTWEPAQTIQVAATGAPIALYGDQQPWVCCDTTCLNGPPPVAPTTCTVKPALSAVGTYAVSDPDLWQATSCMQLVGADDEGKVRVTYPGVCESMKNNCTVSLSPGAPGGGGQTYSLRIEPPVTSIFRSTVVELPVQKGTTQISLPPLERRVLLRGKVGFAACPEGTCVAVAEVLAERVIQGEDPATLLGPYLFSASTIPNTLGEYVLPVNPGVYLVTALPKPGAQEASAGPAPIVVLDLREDSPLVVEKDGVLVADLPDADNLLLTPGSFYTMELDEFDTSNLVIPLDLTTWKGLVAPDGTPLDLNAPGTCLPAEGCQIRRLRAGNSPVRLTQDQLIKFVTRGGDEAQPAD